MEELIPGAGIWIKVGGATSELSLDKKNFISAVEDDNLHLNFDPVLSRLMGPHHEGAAHTAGPCS